MSKPQIETEETKAESQEVCANCGMPEAHYVVYPASMASHEGDGFWTCPKLYGPDGRRLDTSEVPMGARNIGTIFSQMLSRAFKSI